MNDKKVSHYRELEVWNRSMSITVDVYQATDTFPKAELFGLVSQMRRAAVSIPANIAEGNAKDSRRDYRRHVCIARGSLAELETHLDLGNRLGFLSSEHLATLNNDLTIIGRMLTRLITALNEPSDNGGGRGSRK
jgi:four helix bundle protein